MSVLRVECVYALADACWRKTLELPDGATVATALAAADLATNLPGVAVDPARLAVFGRLVALGERLHDGDRIEILRPLALDPKQARRQRAARADKSR